MSEIPPYQQQPNYSNYPRGGGNPDPYRRPPGVYFDNIGQAITLVQGNLGTWVLATLIAFGSYFVCIFAVDFLMIGTMMSTGGRVNPSALLIIYPIFFVIALAFQILFAGLLNMGLKQARGEPIVVGDVFSGFPKAINVILAMLVTSILVAVGLLACFVGSWWVAGLLCFMPLLVVDKGLNPIEALQLSWDTLKPHAWGLFALVFVAGLIGGLGMLACGIGLLFTYPVYFSIMGLAYNNFFPMDAQNEFAYNQPIGFEPPR